ncbi:50S ribosomal protein L9 [Haploplasma modicum]|uniref:50S ribosomal protein L9 n=1 Tax=Haploplasma modicum TaxID=2150 RepID=UPI00214C4981|nr:50S ribosomal protein L9 [Haploplasma modicum]MCR1809319.1 50S ribosomal protein L9 [Haploplasma modicum]
MKKYLPLIITFILFGVGIFIFYSPILTFLKSNTKSLISYLVINLTGLLFVVTVFAYLTNSRSKENQKLRDRLDVWANLSMNISEIGDEVVNILPIGIVIYDDNFDIKWSNKHSSKIFLQNRIIDENIFNISKEFYDIISDNQKTGIITIGEESYDVINEPEFRYAYLFNVTEREQIKLKYNESIQAIGIIYLDNLEESLSSLEISEQSSLKGSYFSSINDWLDKFDCYLKPLSEDSLMFITDRKNIENMIINKFDILDKVRMISKNHNIRVTLSIGVASWDGSLKEVGNRAQSAIELAEKRGGDQAVVNIENKKIEFFGAKSDSVAKSSRVNARINTETLREYIKKAPNVFVVGHNLGDLDSLGSTIAVYRMAKLDNKQVYKVIDLDKMDDTSTKILNLYSSDNQLYENVVSSEAAINLMNDESLLIVVDTQTPKIIMNKGLLAKSKKTIVIDHHRVGDEGFDTVFSIVEPSSSSTIEILMEMIDFYNDKKNEITQLEANIMYGGLVLDTNSFTVRTNTRTFEVAFKLRELGADPNLVKSWLRKDLNRTLSINKLLSNGNLYLDRFMLLSSSDEQIDRILLAQASDEALLIDGIDAAFTIAPVEDVIAVSARSLNDVNVQLVMEHIGGGGHLNSAAAQIKNKTVDEVINNIKEYLFMEYGTEGEEMEVILLEDVKGRGNKDDIIKVALGYANFLVKEGKAIVASAENVKALNDRKAEILKKEANHLELMKKLKGEIESKSVTIEIDLGNSGKMFGSVTTKHIAEEFDKQNGIVLDRKKIELESEINSIGTYEAIISLHKDVKAKIEINVIEKQG